ncbi:MAG: DUF6428 family protein [Flavobacteriia bacterium]|jgi:hypothetical protein
MNLSEFKSLLHQLDVITFKLPNGEHIPAHFHITEIGLLTRNYIDCGGKLREDKSINVQLWYSTDMEHRLKPSKLLNIIEQSERLIDLGEYEMEIEYQQETIAKFGLTFCENQFELTTKQTACLAEDQCGIPESKTKMNLKELTTGASCCPPGGNCC